MEKNENIEAKIKKLVELAKELGLSSLSVEDVDTGISFELAGKNASSTPVNVNESTGETKIISKVESDEKCEGVYVVAPFDGTFYISASPDSPAFVREGNRVGNGDVLCIIEAMKVMNEIQAESDGIVLKILKENGQTIEKDDPLFLIG